MTRRVIVPEPWYRPLAEDIADALDGAPQPAAIDGLLALGCAFARFDPKAERSRALLIESAGVMWEDVLAKNWPRPGGMTHPKVKPSGGMLYPAARDVFDSARAVIERRKIQWTEALSPWGPAVQAGRLSVLCVMCAARCAHPSAIGKREWLEVVERAWETKAMEFETEAVGLPDASEAASGATT